MNPTPRSPSPGPQLNNPYPGIHPNLLLGQVQMAVPFIFHENLSFPPSSHQGYLQHLIACQNVLERGENLLEPLEYFHLCLCAHWATAASFVPTNVDNAIRLKLWQGRTSAYTQGKMAELAINVLNWDYTPVSSRYLYSPHSAQRVSTHEGSWFPVAVAAYCTLKKLGLPASQKVLEAILGEMEREAAIFKEFLESRDGVGILKCAALISHNLGDLDRAMDIWNLAQTDELKVRAYKCGHLDPQDPKKNQRFQGLFVFSGLLNKAYMAPENHRHFALRIPRILRQSRDFLLPIGPFFDDWGKGLANHPQIPFDQLATVVEALVDGQKGLPKTFGYIRALKGILEKVPGGLSQISHYIPVRTQKILKAGPLKTLLNVEKERFELQWARYPFKPGPMPMAVGAQKPRPRPLC